jgi:glycosyltransferase
MKVSIITPVYNNVETIEHTIQSVWQQSYSNIEHIIVDGNSNDGTRQVLEKHRDKIAHLISETDHGIYDAMNKGIDKADGDIIGILNSDDFYVNDRVIQKVVHTFKHNDTDSVYSDLVYVGQHNTDKIVRYWKAGNYYDGIFYNGWMPPHPTFFAKKEVYKKYGKFELRLSSAADYELMLRFLHRYKISTHYIPEVLVKMRNGGNSNGSLLHRLKANREDRKAWRLNGLTPRLWTLYLKPLRKLPQFIQRPKNGRYQPQPIEAINRERVLQTSSQ